MKSNCFRTCAFDLIDAQMFATLRQWMVVSDKDVCVHHPWSGKNPPSVCSRCLFCAYRLNNLRSSVNESRHPDGQTPCHDNLRTPIWLCRHDSGTSQQLVIRRKAAVPFWLVLIIMWAHFMSAQSYALRCAHQTQSGPPLIEGNGW